MNISEASRSTGLTVDTIRFYEKAGMLPRAQRDSRGWRNFSAGDVEWLRNLQRLRATGMPLSDVKQFAALVHTQHINSPGVADQRLAILRRHQLRLADSQRELDDCKSYLNHKISVYSTLEDN